MKEKLMTVKCPYLNNFSKVPIEAVLMFEDGLIDSDNPDGGKEPYCTGVKCTLYDYPTRTCKNRSKEEDHDCFWKGSFDCLE